MVLAAGLGTRLRPITNGVPKCLVSLADRPLIDWTLRWLKDFGITECMINLHYYPEKVREFVGGGSQYGLKVQYSYEPELLRTAGAVKKVERFFEAPFYVIYSDNFSQWNLSHLREECERHEAVGAMAVHWREDVMQSGMIEFDGTGKIRRIVEKPKSDAVTSHFVNAGFYFLDPIVFDYIPPGQFCDFAYHVFPRMLEAGEKIYAVKMEDPIIGIDTIEAYERANDLAKKLLLSQRSQRPPVE